jgi:hypothetical protein
MPRSPSPASAWPKLGLALVATLSRPPCALAVGEQERQLALAAGAALLAGDGRAAGGLLAGIEGQYGVSEVLALHVALGASWHGGTAGTVRATALVAGVTYAVDVLRVVPFFEAGLAFLDRAGGATAGRELGGQVGLGGEYLLDRRWAVAVLARYAYVPLRLSSPAGGPPSLLTLALRLGHTF